MGAFFVTTFVRGALAGAVFLSAAALAGGRAEPTDPRVEAIFAPLAATEAAPGCSVSVRLDGQIVHRRGYGLADRESGRAIAPDTRFRLASVTKTMVAVAVARLAEERAAAGERWLLDRSLEELFGAFRDSAAGSITVRHVLSHTAGLPRDFDALATHVARPTDADVVAWLRTAERPLVLFPGGRYAYSNIGFAVLGALLEKISGQPLEEAVRARIFTPLGMRLATMRHPAKLAGDPRLAVGYEKDGAGWKRAPLTARTCGILGKGGIHATTLDLENLDDAIETKTLLQPATWEEVFRPIGMTQEAKPVRYGLGWETADETTENRPGRWRWHTGYWTGFQTMFYRAEVPRAKGGECRMTAIVLCNNDGAGPYPKLPPIAWKLEKELCR